MGTANRKRTNATETGATKDMTVGSPIRLIVSFATPMLIGNIFQQIYTMIDTMEMGYFVGDSAISAIGAASALYNLLLSLTISMNNGYAIIVTQAFGAHDATRMRRAVGGTLVLNASMTVIVTLGSLLFMVPLLTFMNTPAEIFDQSYIYMMILCAGLCTTVCYNMCAGVLQAVGNSKTPLYILIVSSIVNIALDLFLIIGLGLGVVGTALGTVIAQGLSAVLCASVLLRKYRTLLPRHGDIAASRALWPSLLSSGMAMALMMCVVNLGTIIFQRANNVLGQNVIAAHTASRKIIEAFMQPLGVLATANATFVSQNWGAGKFERIQKTLRRVLGLEVLWGVLACAVVYLLSDPLMRLITGTQNAQIITNGVMSMRIHLPFFPVLGVLLCLRTAMQSMGYKAAPVASSCVELAMKAVGATIFIPMLGYVGTCITEPVTWVLMTIFLGVVYLLRRQKIYGSARREESLEEGQLEPAIAE